MRKRILIAGPIGNFGGRDVEVNIIAKALENQYSISIFSINYLTEQSFALQNLKEIKWNSIHQILFKQNNGIKGLSYMSKWFNGGKKKAYGYVNNSLAKKIYNLEELYWEIIKNELIQNDVVILCVQLTTQYLHKIITFCNLKNIPCIVRTTGTIREIPEYEFEFLKKVKLFIHHSKANSRNLNNQMKLPYEIVDQCTLAEDSLLKLPIHIASPLRFGYLGRFRSEKGILPLAKYFINKTHPFLIAGEGPQRDALLNIIKDNENCKYLGLLKNEELIQFFNDIDVLIIPSFEESGPLVGLEAMAAGKLIISTKVGAMEERLARTKNNFWFNIENVFSLQAKIEEINYYNNETLQEIAESVRREYLNNFKSTNILSKYLEIVKQAQI